MRFPGSKLLHHWDLSSQSVSLPDLLRSCQQGGLTGFAEVKLPQSVAMIFYYLGAEVNALYREGVVAHSGQSALERLRAQVATAEGSVSVYELPLEVAHLLRGITNRHRLRDTLGSGAELAELLNRLEKAEHTGTLEIQNPLGSAMVLIVRGRVSNTYWESEDGLTFEKREARTKLEEALDAGGEVTLFLAEFSRDVWKSRHGVQSAVVSRLERREGATEQLAAEESSTRQQVLEELAAELPSVIQVFVFDMMTGAILARHGRGSSGLPVGLLSDKVPAFTLYLRDLVAAEAEDRVDVLEVTTERMSVLVAVVAEVQEAIAVVADRAQPGAQIARTITRAARGYAERLASAAGPTDSGGARHDN